MSEPRTDNVIALRRPVASAPTRCVQVLSGDVYKLELRGETFLLTRDQLVELGMTVCAALRGIESEKGLCS